MGHSTGTARARLLEFFSFTCDIFGSLSKKTTTRATESLSLGLGLGSASCNSIAYEGNETILDGLRG